MKYIGIKENDFEKVQNLLKVVGVDVEINEDVENCDKLITMKDIAENPKMYVEGLFKASSDFRNSDDYPAGRYGFDEKDLFIESFICFDWKTFAEKYSESYDEKLLERHLCNYVNHYNDVFRNLDPSNTSRYFWRYFSGTLSFITFMWDIESVEEDDEERLQVLIIDNSLSWGDI